MLLGEVLQVALGAIAANKMRSFLTMLGIIIGIAAVITMVSLGEGAQANVKQRLQSMGANLGWCRRLRHREPRRVSKPRERDARAAMVEDHEVKCVRVLSLKRVGQAREGRSEARVDGREEKRVHFGLSIDAMGQPRESGNHAKDGV